MKMRRASLLVPLPRFHPGSMVRFSFVSTLTGGPKSAVMSTELKIVLSVTFELYQELWL